MTTSAKLDARGVPIKIGSLCIYGAPVGRSIALVEGKIESFTPSGRVNVRVIRRAYGGWGNDKPVVHVGADRLIQVYENGLPFSDLPTEEEKARRQANRQSHSLSTRRIEDPISRKFIANQLLPCSRCGAVGDQVDEECPA